MKKKTKSKSVETTAPSAFTQPYVDSAAQQLQPAFQDQQAVEKSFRPGLLSAANYYTDTLGGKYLDEGNPHLQGIIDSSNRDITDTVNGQFNSRFGSGYHAGALARQLGENEQRLRYGDYATERGYQNDAGRNLAGVGTTATALAGLPAESYAQNIAGLLGRYGTGTGSSTTTQSGGVGGMLGGILGAGLSGWASGGFASDRRLKMDITKLGEEPDGLGVYEYRYVTDQPDAPLRKGVMADEVEKLRPWALGPKRGDFATVNYGAL